MVELIGVSGQMQNGKDTLADYLKLKLNGNWKRVAFAKNVKQIFIDYFGVDAQFIEKWKVIDENPPKFKKSVRKSLQFIGDGFREILDNIWIDKLFNTETYPIIISDCRYINELKEIRNRGGLNILIWRPGMENNDPNGSEAQIKPVVEFYAKLGIEGKVTNCYKLSKDIVPTGADYIDYFIINNNVIDKLYNKIDELILQDLVENVKM